ncbi:hypothetical protein FACS1894156_8760 [Bacteroidia bacterium]|nr:hypothetical protein FACS1894156_8760 [Bacteroidia bacterium]
MEEKLSIRINIAERFYPMRIERHDEENVRLAAKMVNEKLSDIRQKQPERDLQDLLSMTAFRIALSLIEQTQKQDKNIAIKGMLDLDKKLTEYLEYAKEAEAS